MAHSVEWLPAAIDDLDAIASYIASDSPKYASVVVEKMLRIAADLADFPLMGRKVPEWDDPSVREWIIYSYRLIYHVTATKVLVLAVIHVARLLPDDIRGRATDG